MESLFNTIKSELGKYKNSIQTVTGLISILTGLISLVTSVLNSTLNIAIICIGIFFINLGVCNKLITSRKESFGITVNRLSNSQIKNVKRIVIGSYLLWLFPIYFCINYFHSKSNNCKALTNNIGLIITSFTNANDDNFSYKLFTLLETELENADTINTIRTEKFINAGDKTYQDSIGQLFSSNCFRKGLLIFGKRSDQSKFFDCSIYLNNFLNFNDPIGLQNKKIINLQNPDFINFSIEYQAQAVSEFILGLLYGNANNFLISTKKFQHCSDLISNDENRKLKSYCCLFIGNNFYKEKIIKNAIKSYQSGINYDPYNAYLHFNLATAFLSNGDSLNANKEYIVANNLNNKLINPIGNMERLTQAKKQDSTRTIGYENNKIQKPTVKEDSSQKNNQTLESKDIQSDYIKMKINDKYGVINKRGDTIVKCAYDYVAENVFVYKNQLFFIVGNNQLFGALDLFGRLVIPIKSPSVENVKSLIQVQVGSK